MRPDLLKWPVISVVILAGIGALSLVSYLLFHSVVEFATVVVGFGVFTLTWNLRRTIDNSYFLLVGVAAFFIGALDLVHTLAYKGMGVFSGHDANLPTQLWIASRYLTSLTLLAAPLVIDRKLDAARLLALYGAVTAGLLALVFTGIFPDSYVEGAGLTPFKRVSELVVSLILVGALLLLVRRRHAFDGQVMGLQALSVALTIASGVPFVLYTQVDDNFNMAGHLLRLAAIVPLYRAVVETGLRQPTRLLFRNLKQSEEALRAERNFVTSVLDMAGAPLVVLDEIGCIVRANHAVLELAGHITPELTGMVLWDKLIPPAEVQTARENFLWPIVTGEVHSFEQHWISPGGDRRLIWWNAHPLAGEGGAVRYAICTGVDVTERRQLEQQLQDREEHHRTLVESIPTGMLLIDRTTRRVSDVNPAAAKMLGLSPEQIIGRPCTEFLPSSDCDGDLPELSRPTDTALRTADGRTFPIHRTVAPVVTGGREQLLLSFVDMTEQKEMEEELRSMALLDELTGLHNRRGFLTLAPKEIALSLKLNRGMFLMFIDLDDLQRINESGGHRAGDQALRALGQILQAAFSPTALVARMGGDEFVVLMPQYAGLDTGLLTARLRRHLEMHNTATRSQRISVSAGVATLSPAAPCTINQLLTLADDAMYLERRRKLLHQLSAVHPLPGR